MIKSYSEFIRQFPPSTEVSKEIDGDVIVSIRDNGRARGLWVEDLSRRGGHGHIVLDRTEEQGRGR